MPAKEKQPVATKPKALAANKKTRAAENQARVRARLTNAKNKSVSRRKEERADVAALRAAALKAEGGTRG